MKEGQRDEENETVIKKHLGKGKTQNQRRRVRKGMKNRNGQIIVIWHQS